MKRNILMSVLILMVIMIVNPAYSCDGCIAIGNDLKMDICAEYHGAIYGFTLNYIPDFTGFYWKMDFSSFRQLQTAENCIHTEDNLALNICCANYQEVNYKFILNYYQHPKDPFGIYWKMDVGTLGQSVIQPGGINNYTPLRDGLVLWETWNEQGTQKILGSPPYRVTRYGTDSVVSFNDYVDSTWLGQAAGQLPSSEDGLIPEINCNPKTDQNSCYTQLIRYAYGKTDRFGIPLFKYLDEREFVAAANTNQISWPFTYYHIVPDLKIGDIVRIRVVISNSAKTTPDYPANNTKVTLDWTNPQFLKAVISADNASSVSDMMTLGFTDNQSHNLKPVADSSHNIGIYRYDGKTKGLITVGSYSPYYVEGTKNLIFPLGNVSSCAGCYQILYFDFEIIN